MAISVECPNCGGSLSPKKGETVVKCKYCGSSVRLDPAEMSSNDGLPPDIQREIIDLLREGKKIEAIKLHRNHFSGSLKDSKLAVENMGRKAGIPVGSGSCSVMAAALILLALLIMSTALS
jgi:transcription elongation factor Elf1